MESANSTTIQMIPTRATLIEFDEPYVIGDCKEKEECILGPHLEKKVEEEINEMLRLRRQPGCLESEMLDTYTFDEILDTIISPVEWTCGNEMGGKSIWRQTATDDEVTRDELVQLSLTLEKNLKERHANNISICPVRRQLYSQFFDELIRQTATTMSPEIALLLTRIRDESKMTVDVYDSIFQSCKYFQSKCIVMPPKSETMDDNQPEPPTEQEMRVTELNIAKRNLGQEISKLRDGMVLREKIHKDVLDSAEALYQEEVEHLNKVMAQLAAQLELFKGPNPHAETGEQSILDKFLKQRGQEREKQENV